MVNYISLYKSFILQYIKTLMQSKVNFFIGLIGFLLMQFLGILFLNIVFVNIPTLNGWSFNEVLFIYGFAQLPRGIDHLFSDYLWIFSSTSIVRGDFDKYLLRPINPLFYILSERLQLDAIGEIIVGLFITIYSIIKLQLKFTFINTILFILVIIASTLIYFSIKLFFASLSFWIKDSFSLLNTVYTLSDLSKYPNTIYPKGVQLLLSFIIPFAFTSFIPACYFLNRSSIYNSIFITIIISLVCFFIAYNTWLKGIKIYESSGN